MKYSGEEGPISAMALPSQAFNPTAIFRRKAKEWEDTQVRHRFRRCGKHSKH